eukprot:8900864-Ditylum_brightwellii.AAC.1
MQFEGTMSRLSHPFPHPLLLKYGINNIHNNGEDKDYVGGKQTGSEQKGPNYLGLTHTDDVGDHYKWAQHLKENNYLLKQKCHAKDLDKNDWIGDNTLGNANI